MYRNKLPWGCEYSKLVWIRAVKSEFQNVLKLVKRVKDNNNKTFRSIIRARIGEDTPDS